jgi:hypothetical protein
MPDDDLRAALDRLTAEVALLNRREKFLRMLGTNLMRGLAFGLGSVLGASLLVSILGWWVAQFEFLPLIGQWAVRIVDEINRARQ